MADPKVELTYQGVTSVSDIPTSTPGETQTPYGFEVLPSLIGPFTDRFYFRALGDAGCYSTTKTLTGASWFSLGPSTRMKGLVRDETPSHVCLFDFKRLVLGYSSDGKTPDKETAGFKLEAGRLHADDSPARAMKKYFLAGVFDGARGDLGMNLSWGALLAYGWTSNSFKYLGVEAAVMNGGYYSFNDEVYGAFRLKLRPGGKWQPLIAPYVAGRKGPDDSKPTSGFGIYMELPFGSDFMLIASAARNTGQAKDAKYIYELVNTSYNLGGVFKVGNRFQLTAGWAAIAAAKGETVKREYDTEAAIGWKPSDKLILQVGILYNKADRDATLPWVGLRGQWD